VLPRLSVSGTNKDKAMNTKPLACLLLILVSCGQTCRADNEEKGMGGDILNRVEQSLTGEIIRLDGKVRSDKNGSMLESVDGEREYKLNLDSLGVVELPDGKYQLTCKIVLNTQRTAISSIVVVKAARIKATENDLLYGIISEIMELVDIAYSKNGKEELKKHIDRVAIVLMAQRNYYERFYPVVYAKAKKNVDEGSQKSDPFETRGEKAHRR